MAVMVRVKAPHRVRQTYTGLREHLGLIVIIGSAGIAAYTAAGFFGYPSEPDPLSRWFHAAWPLFLWMSALLLVLESYLLREHRAQRRVTFGVTLLCIVLVVAAYLNSAGLIWLVGKILNLFGTLPHGKTLRQVIFTLINVVPLLVFAGATARRWWRRWHGQVPNPRHPDVMPEKQDLVSGDLIGGAAIAGFFWVVFAADYVWLPLGVDTSNFQLPGTGTPLAFLDQVLALLCLACLFILAMSALVTVLRGQGKGSAVPALPASGVAGVLADEVEAESPRVAARGLRSQLRDVLGSVLNHSITAIAWDGVAGTGRVVLWPVLVLAATASVGIAAHYNQLYLHVSSYLWLCDRPAAVTSAACVANAQDFVCRQKPWEFGGLCIPAGTSPQQSHTLALGLKYAFLGVSAGGIAAAGLLAVLAATVLVINARIAEDGLRFLGSAGARVFLTLWLFEIPFLAVNALVLTFDSQGPKPFIVPGAVVLSSLGLFLLALVPLPHRRSHR